MGLLSSFKQFFKDSRDSDPRITNVKDTPTGKVNGQTTKKIQIGTTGTDITGGYFDEEYLRELRGNEAADVYDMMRRSDSIVKMCTTAHKNPIRSADWEIAVKADIPEGLEKEAEAQRLLCDKIFMKGGIGKTWKSFITEALTIVDYGYVLFEVTDKVVLNDPTLGTYIGLHSLGYRSQKSIEQWFVNRDGSLGGVRQQASGDLQSFNTLDGRFLLHMALEKEGDNYEGISMLRSCYGAWLRKNHSLKMKAAGDEKYSIPTPILEIPPGQESGKRFQRAVAWLKTYISTIKNYLTIPQGWKLDTVKTDYDPEKLTDSIKFEDSQIVSSFLANFLLLGQTGSGSYALSFDLSDFFLGGLEYTADQITEAINTYLIPRIIRLNFPNSEPLVELSYSGIRERAGKEIAEITATLVDKGIITADETLEDFLRKKFNLPALDKETVREAQQGGTVPPSDDPLPPTPLDEVTKEKAEKLLAELRTLTQKKSLKLAEDKPDDKVLNLIKDQSEKNQALFKKSLKPIADQVVDKVIKNKGPEGIKPEDLAGIDKYTDDFLENNAESYAKSLELVRNENPRFKAVKLSETENVYRFAEIDKLSKGAQNKLRKNTFFLVDTQILDIIKQVGLTYQVNSDLDEALIRDRLDTKVDDMIEGSYGRSGAGIITTQMINDARKEFYSASTISPEIESFTFLNDDPKSEICKFLNNKTYAADDPRVDLYWPPLHHLCDTYVRANYKGDPDNPPITDGGDPPESAQKSITLGEFCCGCGQSN